MLRCLSENKALLYFSAFFSINNPVGLLHFSFNRTEPGQCVTRSGFVERWRKRYTEPQHFLNQTNVLHDRTLASPFSTCSADLRLPFPFREKNKTKKPLTPTCLVLLSALHFATSPFNTICSFPRLCGQWFLSASKQMQWKVEPPSHNGPESQSWTVAEKREEHLHLLNVKLNKTPK